MKKLLTSLTLLTAMGLFTGPDAWAVTSDETEQAAPAAHMDLNSKREVYEISIQQVIQERIRYAMSHNKQKDETALATKKEEDPLAHIRRDYDTEVKKIFESLY